MNYVLAFLFGIVFSILYKRGAIGLFFCLLGVHGKRKEYSILGPGYYWGVTVCHRCGKRIKHRDVQKKVEGIPSIPDGDCK